MVSDTATSISETQDGPAEFVLPDLSISENGWGPVASQEEQPFIRFAPYSKSDRIGRVADWTVGTGDVAGVPDQYRRGDDRRRRMQQFSSQFYGSKVDSAFSFGNDRDEDATFSLVDRSAVQKRPNFRRNRYMRGGYFSGRGSHSNVYGRGHHMGGFNQQQTRRDDKRLGGYRRSNAWNEKISKPKEPSIPIEDSWVEIGEFEFPMLSKLCFTVEDPVDLHFCGSIYAYDTKFDKIKPKTSAVELKADVSRFIDPPVANDVYIDSISSQFGDEFVIFTSEKTLSALMCAPSSILPWDIKIEKKGNILYLDKRPNGPIDVIHVNETGTDVPLTEGNDVNVPNTPAFLSEEAAYSTFLTLYFAQDKNSYVKFGEPMISKIPKTGDGQTESGGETIVKSPPGYCYRYRKWTLGDGVSIVSRVKVDFIAKESDSTMTPKGSIINSDDAETVGKKYKFLNLKALNECDPRASNVPNHPQGWNKSLDTNCGTVMANEIKNNYNKISRWIVETSLGGVSTAKIAFVSRINPRTYTTPILLLVANLSNHYLGDSPNVPTSKTCWGIVKTFADYFKTKLEDGSYVLIKDPSKPVLRLYQCSMSKKRDVDEDGEIDITVRDELAD